MPFPWFMPQQSHQEMGPKDYFEFIKQWDEYQKSKEKPKDDKPKKDPNAWDTLDYLTFIVAFHWTVAIVGSCFILHYAAEFMKATH